MVDRKLWTEGFKDAYAARATATRITSLFAGRLAGEVLRVRHQQEYERCLFDGPSKPAPKATQVML